MENKDLTICQDCGENPATYGDGSTWSRCSACQRKAQEREGVPTESQSPAAPEQSFEHTIVPGLVSVIIPVYINNYTLFHYTGNCIGAVREHSPEGAYEIVIVDNGSPLKPPSPLSYYAHRVIEEPENTGVTKAWNKGIRISVGEYIVLLNNDVQVFDGWLEDMKAALDNGFDLVMAHPMYSLTEPFARATEAKLAREGKKKFDSIPGGKDFSCVMMKRALLDEIGLFDEQFFNYCSDADFFARMDEAKKSYTILDTVFTSHISDATGYSIEKTPEIMNEDKARYAAKYAKPSKLAESGQGSTDLGGLERSNLFRIKGGGDPIYLKVGESYHKISNPDTLHALGFEFGDESVVEEPLTLEKGEEINMENVEKYKNA